MRIRAAVGTCSKRGTLDVIRAQDPLHAAFLCSALFDTLALNHSTLQLAARLRRGLLDDIHDGLRHLLVAADRGQYRTVCSERRGRYIAKSNATNHSRHWCLMLVAASEVSTCAFSAPTSAEAIASPNCTDVPAPLVWSHLEVRTKQGVSRKQRPVPSKTN